MAADSVVFRPRRLRVIVVVATIALVGISAFGWFALPLHIRVLFSLSQRLTLLAVLAALIGVIAAAASSYVRADAHGLQIRNGVRRHVVPWDRVHKILLRPGDPWAMLLVKPTGEEFKVDLDAEKRMMMGIQAHDGSLAVAAVEELRSRLLTQRS
ncbi:MAG TPA: PH domain-containing protein [Propionibacteriaceae bacterium]